MEILLGALAYNLARDLRNRPQRKRNHSKPAILRRLWQRPGLLSLFEQRTHIVHDAMHQLGHTLDFLSLTSHAIRQEELNDNLAYAAGQGDAAQSPMLGCQAWTRGMRRAFDPPLGSALLRQLLHSPSGRLI